MDRNVAEFIVKMAVKKGKKIKPGMFKGGPSKPAAKAPAGSGKRFKALKAQLAAKGAKNPAALAAAIGRAKFGKKKFQQMAAAGRRKKASEVTSVAINLARIIDTYRSVGY